MEEVGQTSSSLSTFDHVQIKVKELASSLSIGIASSLNFLHGPPVTMLAPVTMLGQEYHPHAHAEEGEGGSDVDSWSHLKEDFSSRVWCTYRKSFPSLGGLQTDVGWGCTYRTGQMLAAEAMSRHLLGRHWRQQAQGTLPTSPPTTTSTKAVDDSPPPSSDGPLAAQQQLPMEAILSLLSDHDSAPLSLHSLCEKGRPFGAHPGRWIGPSGICRSLEAALACSLSDGSCAGMTGHVIMDPQGGGGAPIFYHEHIKTTHFGPKSSSPKSSESFCQESSEESGTEDLRLGLDAGLDLDPCQGEAEALSSPRGHLSPMRGHPSPEDTRAGGLGCNSSRANLPHGFDRPASPPPLDDAPTSTSDGACLGPLLLLLPLTLGLGRSINPSYICLLKACLSLPQSVGILGGRPGASLYFIGFQDNNLLYLDPHEVHKAAPPEGVKAPHSTSLVVSAFSSYFCSTIRMMPAASIDPSLAIGFLCSTTVDFDRLVRSLQVLISQSSSHPLLTLSSTSPPPVSESIADARLEALCMDSPEEDEGMGDD